MSGDPCPAGCNAGLLNDDICATCNGSGEAEPAPAKRTRRAPTPQPQEPVAGEPIVDAVALSDAEEWRATASAAPAPRVEIVNDYTNDYERVRATARDTYRGMSERSALLRWIDARGQMMRPALHPLEPLWLEKFDEFYASRRLIMLARKALRAGGSSSACPALVRCAVFGDRRLDAGTIGVIPIMSATRDEADGRFTTIRSFLRAIGLSPPQKGKQVPIPYDDSPPEPDDDGMVYSVPPGGVKGTFQSKRSPSGGGVIAIQDRHGHRIQFRILPALVKHGVGYTGVAGLADESDLWPNDPEHHVNPAERILGRVAERFTTTHDPSREDPGAEFLIFSASYSPDSAHKRAIDDVIASERGALPVGRDPVLTSALAHVARIGERGARRDEEARRALAMSIGSNDPRLLAPSDSTSPDLPTWVFNPTETIEKCYRFSKSLSYMLAMYGGRAAEHEVNGRALFGIKPTIGTVGAPVDVVLGVAPSDIERPWGAVVAQLDASGKIGVRALDVSDVRELHTAALSCRASVLVTPRKIHARVEAELLSAYAGTALPPLAAQEIHDGGEPRLASLVTLYQRERIVHAALDAESDALATALRSVVVGGPRVPRVEALLAAVMRLVSCYPWMTEREAKRDDAPIHRPLGALTLDVRGQWT